MCDQATPQPCVVFMPEGSRTHKGGTMRLGTRRTLLQTADCVSAKLYQVRVRPGCDMELTCRRLGGSHATTVSVPCTASERALHRVLRSAVRR